MSRRSLSRLAAALLILVVLQAAGGCTLLRRWGWMREPAEIEFPDPPPVTWLLCEAERPCLSPADANLLNKWLDKLRAFKAARDRLLKD